MSRDDEPTTLAGGDDEITTDVDPAWVASIRAGTNTSASSPAVQDDIPVDEAVDENGPDDWALAEPRWDPEATVGASDGLIERIRREVQATPVRPVTTPTPTSPETHATTAATVPAAPPRDAPPVPTALVAAPPAPTVRPAPPPPILIQPSREGEPTGVPTTATVPGVEELVSTTVRWEPRQRLAATAPVTDNVVIPPPTHQGLDKTKVLIALIIAVALVIVVWLFVGSRGSDEPVPPGGSVPTSDGATTGSVASSGSTPVDPEAPAEVGG